MTWSLVAEVLVLLAAGTGATKWMAHEKRPARKDFEWKSSEEELKLLLKGRKRLVKDYYSNIAQGYPSLARGCLESLTVLDRRAERLRDEVRDRSEG